MNDFRLYLLGPFRATLAGQSVQGFAYNKVRALLAYLAVESQEPHSRETLAALLWPETGPDAARTSLRQTLSRLRKNLGDAHNNPPILLLQRDTVQFNPDCDSWLDVDQLKGRLDAVLNHPHLQFESCQSCVSDLEEAAALYRGNFLQGLMIDSLEFEEWSLTLQENLHTQMLTALHQLTQHYLHRGDYGLAQKHALCQVAMEPYREEAHRALMLSLARSGQRSAALAQYERCRGILADELGVVPSRETQALYKRIRAMGTTRPHNLPPLQETLIGRERELQEIGELLANPERRLVTLVGMGGIGKTSLALQAAQEHLGYFLHGTYWVSLASLRDPGQLITAIITALPVTQGSDPETQLLDYLRDKSLLLVLDNFEHLIPAKRGSSLALDIVNKILCSAHLVKLLVTSRERLSLRAEWVLHVGGLPYPKNLTTLDASKLSDYAAIQLFIRRAQQVVSTFPANPDVNSQIAQICQLLQGIPLGIELASGWVDQLTCAEISAEIESNFDFLVTSLRDTPDRHQSLRAVFEHSWKLLSTEEQIILRKLAVFQSAFSRSAARAISGAALHQLTALMNKSFLRFVGGNYSLHLLLQQFLVQELAANPDEDRQTRNTHAAYFARFLKDREYALTVQYQATALDETEAVLADVTTAWDWSITQKDTQIIAEALDGLFIYFWARSQFTTGQSTLDRAVRMIQTLSKPSQDKLLLARLNIRIADFIYWQDDLQVAEKLLRAHIPTLQAWPAPEELAFAQELLGRIYYWQGEYAQAKENSHAAIATARQAGTPHHLAQALNLLASVICDESGDFEVANSLYTESLALYQQIGNPFGIAKTLINQGAIFYEQGDLARAEALYRESLKQYRQIDYAYGTSACLNNLAIIARERGNFKQAKALIQESLVLKRETGNRVALLHSLLEIGVLAIQMEHYPEAHQHFSEALKIAQQVQAGNLLFDILLGFAELYAQTGAEEQALELAIWVSVQENVGQKAYSQAKDISARLEQPLLPTEFKRCQERAHTKNLHAVINELLER